MEKSQLTLLEERKASRLVKKKIKRTRKINFKTKSAGQRKKTGKKNSFFEPPPPFLLFLFSFLSSSNPIFSRGVVREARPEGVVLVHRLLQHRAEVPDDDLGVSVDGAVADFADLEALPADRGLVPFHLGEAVSPTADPLSLVDDAVVEADAQGGRNGVPVVPGRGQRQDVEVEAPRLSGFGVVERGDAQRGAVAGAALVLEEGGGFWR